MSELESTTHAQSLPAVIHDNTELAPGDFVDRYVILARVGAGGMGVVYAAYDPDLDRKVALKMLRGDRRQASSTRIRREARALARLSHPNVVAVHDIGVLGDELWLAMEFVDGSTLDEWLAARPRSWPEVLAIFVAVGRGVAAAHAASVLHRDLKPSNIMIGEDGRARVMDFGLARGEADEQEPADGEAPRRDDPLVETLTQPGAVLGTPAYMAPEQLTGLSIDARADQFSFCATLWEALYGERPFARGDTEGVLGERRATRTGAGVPRWLRRACERGLALSPDQRWPSIDALVETLAQGRSRARLRGLGLSLGVLVAVASGAAGASQIASERSEARVVAACEQAGASIEQPWTPARHQDLRAALLSSELDYAADATTRALAYLDDYAKDWREAKTQTCLDHELRGQIDDALANKAAWCLENGRAAFEALLDELSEGHELATTRAISAAASLPPVAWCRDPTNLASLPTLPEARQGEALAVIETLSRADALSLLGQLDAALVHTIKAVAAAETLDWAPLEARAMAQLARMQLQLGRFEESRSSATDAFFLADRSETLRLRADAAIQLMTLSGYLDRRSEDAALWARLAESALVRLEGEQRLLHARLDRARALTAFQQGDYPLATRSYERVLEAYEALYGPKHPFLNHERSNFAAIIDVSGDKPRARDIFAQIVADFELTLGPDHPELATPLRNLGLLEQGLGEPERALSLLRRAKEIRLTSFGPENPKLTDDYTAEALALTDLGRFDEAREALEAALEIVRRVHGENHLDYGTILSLLGFVERRADNLPEAAAQLERALAIVAANREHEHLDFARVQVQLALVYAELDRHDEAHHLLEHALATTEASIGPDKPEVADSLIPLAKEALHREHSDEAISLADRAIAILEADGHSKAMLGDARATRARALWQRGDHQAAREVARAALADFDDAGSMAAEQERERLAAWLAER
ncbi:serine/threonine protein kinase [Pseudenhygromyxa sp. WMMC2535]|uniref:serine/threonine-protein kinase n=1 Tax=Pseudenhygromyxa sp. WMMC2535 TaxID=2712867 RepID=UPI00155737C4|nr:serine/threonine-protein kinase [Pseudenhygromyxa sp. WMMC2535]NVB42838.1 serine/threonine protein kinase [Pseudenhygromyxa sp. WMMC2535]